MQFSLRLVFFALALSSLNARSKNKKPSAPAALLQENCELAAIPEREAVARLKANFWTMVDTQKYFRTPNGKIDPEIISALLEAYDTSPFKTAKGVAIGGLTCTPPYEVGFNAKLPVKAGRKIELWGNKVLKISQAATEEKLKIENIYITRAFRVGNKVSLIHIDNALFYLHGFATLQGESAIIFPDAPELVGYTIVDRDPMGRLIVQAPKGKKRMTIDPGLQAELGQTALITGNGFFGARRFQRERVGQATVHSSPVEITEDRVALFVDIQPE